jgi:hypothetical protein
LAYKENFLHRPIVNEYINILAQSLKELGIYVEPEKNKFRINMTHDIDHFFIKGLQIF